MPRILIPTALYGQTGGKHEVVVPGATLDEALANLAACCPDIKKHLFKDDGGGDALAPAGQARHLALRSFVRAFIGDTDAQLLQVGATPVAEETEIRIVPGIAGGAGNLAAFALAL